MKLRNIRGPNWVTPGQRHDGDREDEADDCDIAAATVVRINRAESAVPLSTHEGSCRCPL